MGHRVRPAAALALWTSVAGGVAFTAFAYITTQDHAVRAGSPWQNDPYDGVVSFTEFLVPAVILLIAARASLWRRSQPQPLFRVNHLLRAAAVCTVLVAMTVVTDWLAVAMRADGPLWNGVTPWLIASLVPLTAIAAVSLLLQRRAFHRVPRGHNRQPDGDWLDDLAALTDMVAAHLPAPVRRMASRFTQGGAIGFVRGHIVAFAALLSLVAGLGITTAQAVGEGWSNPLLFFTGNAVGFGGFFAFCLVSNTVLHIAVPRDSAKKRGATTGRTRRATRAAVIAASLALPTSAVLRDPIWSALGQPENARSIGALAGVVAASAVLTGVVVFAVILAISRSKCIPDRSR